MFLLAIIHLVSIIVPIILAVLKSRGVQVLLYWILNIVFPSINAQAIITYNLAQKSAFCKTSKAGLDEFFPEIGDDTIWANWIILLLHIVVLLTIIILIDTGFLRLSFGSSNNSSFDENYLDDDVRAERRRVLNSQPAITSDDPVNFENGDQGWKSDHLAVHDLVKHYRGSNKLAVNHLSFGAKRGEAFGLLGYNVSIWTNLSIDLFYYFNRVLEKQRLSVYLSVMKLPPVVQLLSMNRMSLVVYDQYVVLVIVHKWIAVWNF